MMVKPVGESRVRVDVAADSRRALHGERFDMRQRRELASDVDGSVGTTQRSLSTGRFFRSGGNDAVSSGGFAIDGSDWVQ